jgi:hypothetical protein
VSSRKWIIATFSGTAEEDHHCEQKMYVMQFRGTLERKKETVEKYRWMKSTGILEIIENNKIRIMIYE